MKYGRYGWPHLTLITTLSLALIYIGLDSFLHQSTWAPHIPSPPFLNIDSSSWIKIISISSLALGLLLLTKIGAKLISIIASLYLFILLIQNSLGASLPGTLALLGLSLALALWPGSYHKRRHWWNRKPKPKITEED